MYHGIGLPAYDSIVAPQPDARDTYPSQLLFKLLRDMGISQAGFGRLVNESPQTITNWKARGVPKGAIVKVAQALGIRVEDYLTGAAVVPLAPKVVKEPTPAGVVVIPVLDARASMGNGEPLREHDAVVGRLEVGADWVRTALPFITATRNLRVITGYGDSMADTYQDGDILLVDTGVREVKVDAIYTLTMGGELFIKRVQRRPDGSLTIISDNRKYDSFTVQNGERADLEVLGRVVWAWNGRRL